MRHKVIFDINSSKYFCANSKINKMFIRQQETYLNDLLRVRGYVYLNYIHEQLGIRWNPKDTNYCCLYEDGSEIKFKIVTINENSFEITITW